MQKFLGFLTYACVSSIAMALPPGFVYLHEINGSIQQDLRYATPHNFVGRPIKGYQSGKCILTREAALALSRVQQELEESSLSLKVYDCYRPEIAVSDFIAWSKQAQLQQMKSEFYPNTAKNDFFKLGYVADKSGHSRGSTIDVTIVSIPYLKQAKYRPGQRLLNCTNPYLKRFRDNSIDMGTGFDCMDEAAHTFSKQINHVAMHHRMLLRSVMIKQGFEPYDTEWWHFTLKNEPYPNTYFNFPVS